MDVGIGGQTQRRHGGGSRGSRGCRGCRGGCRSRGSRGSIHQDVRDGIVQLIVETVFGDLDNGCDLCGGQRIDALGHFAIEMLDDGTKADHGLGAMFTDGVDTGTRVVHGVVRWQAGGTRGGTRERTSGSIVGRAER